MLADLTPWARRHPRVTRATFRAVITSGSITMWLFWTSCMLDTITELATIDPALIVFDLILAGITWSFTWSFHRPYAKAKAAGYRYPC